MTPKNLLSFRGDRVVGLVFICSTLYFSRFVGAPLWAVCLVLAAWPLVGLLRRKSTLDEGGLRFHGILGIGRGYCPFSEIGRIILSGDSRLYAVDSRGKRLEEWDIADPNVCGEVYLAMCEKLDARHPVEAPVLERGPRSLSAWLEGIAAAAHSSGLRRAQRARKLIRQPATENPHVPSREPPHAHHEHP